MDERDDWPMIDGVDGWFQGNVEPFTEDFVYIDGCYTIFTGRLSIEQDRELFQIYPKLPGEFRINPHDGMPYWFGDTQNDIRHLTVSFEPSGIVVSGVVSKRDWKLWDSTFRALVDEARIPRFPG